MPESIEETLKAKGEKPLNEAKLGDFLKKTKETVKGLFKKIGKYFVALYQDKILPVMMPVNIGILKKEGKLPAAVQYVASAEDIKLEPSLASLKDPKVVLERVKRGYLEDAKKNKARKKLQKLWENAKFKYKDSINEDEVKLKYPGTEKIPDVDSKFLIKRILLQVKNPKLSPPLIFGAPGIGKTAITNSVIESLGEGYRLIDVQTSKMAPDDWSLPAIVDVKEAGLKQAVDIPKNWLPVYEPSNDPEENAKRNDKANWGNGGIIFLDELSRANEAVQNTCLKLVHQRIIGDKVLGSKWAIVAASNREEDDPEGGQTAIGKALADRFQIFNFIPSVDEWIEWAKGKGIDDRITTFVDFNRDHFYLFDNEKLINTTPRSWEALSDVLQSCKDYGDIIFTRSDLDVIMSSTIHSKTVEVFKAFLALIETFRPEEILMVFEDPNKAPKPKKAGSGFDVVQCKALMGAICSQSKDKKLTSKELENYVQYWVNINNASIASAALFLIVETHPYIHSEIGEIKGKDKYKKAMDIFRAAYGSTKMASREEVMGNL